MTKITQDNAWTKRDAVGFLVRFGQQDLGAYSEGDLLNLGEDFTRFFAVAATENFPLAVRVESRSQTFEYFRRVQPHVKQLLDAAVRDWESDAPPDSVFAGIGVKTPLVEVSAMPLANGRVIIQFGDGIDPVTFIQFKAALLLLGEGRKLIRRCPVCQTIFLRVKKQRYCSRKCTNTASQRTYLSKSANQTKHRESSHKTYARQTRKRTGPNVLVARRPRQE